MIEFKTGNLLEEEAEALVNTVNCVGIMGRGVALSFKKTFPDNFRAYAKACEEGAVQPGKMFVYETGHMTNPRLIINFPTKRHWRGKSRIEDIETGLKSLIETIRDYGIKSIAIPPLGSGLGGLNWPEVKSRIKDSLQSLPDLNVVVYEPSDVPALKQASYMSDKPPVMTPARATLVGLMRRYIGGLLDPFVTLLEVHKLMYFMQEAGEPLKLRYKKEFYGPYATNLRHVLTMVEGHYVSGFDREGDSPDNQLELVPGAFDDAMEFLEQSPDTKERFDRVTDLVEGFESSFGLELLSTVHWVCNNESVGSEDDIVERTYAWNDRKQQFTPRQIKLAVDVLSKKGWVKPLPSQVA